MIRIFRKENWQVWKSGPFSRKDFLLIDPAKDRLLYAHMLAFCSEPVQKDVRQRYSAEERQGRTDLYDLLPEQILRESDESVLKTAAYEAPDDAMRRFAFCRLTGYSFDADARTYACGLLCGITREKIEEFCSEMIRNEGPFAKEAEECLMTEVE